MARGSILSQEEAQTTINFNGVTNTRANVLLLESNDKKKQSSKQSSLAKLIPHRISNTNQLQIQRKSNHTQVN